MTNHLGMHELLAPLYFAVSFDAIKACTHIQSTLLRECDPHLWQQMQKVGIEPQIYGMSVIHLQLFVL